MFRLIPTVGLGKILSRARDGGGDGKERVVRHGGGCYLSAVSANINSTDAFGRHGDGGVNGGEKNGTHDTRQPHTFRRLSELDLSPIKVAP